MIDWISLLTPSLIGAVVGFAVWYFQSRIEALRRAQERLHDERRTIYTNILDPFIRVFVGVKNPRENQKALQQMLSVDYKRTAFQFTLVGADDVVRSFNEFMQYMYSLEEHAGQGSDMTELMRLWGAFLLTIRKNVGNPDTCLTEADMLRGQIKDIDSFFA